MIPTIETERLILRAPGPGDVDAVCAMWGDAAVTRYISGDPLARRQAWTGMLFFVGHWDFYGYGGWVAEEKSSGAFVGQVGFQRFVRGIDAAREHLPEAGWALASAMQGRGYGGEAVTAMLSWADTHIDAPQTVAIVHPDNTASLRVASRLGYREVERAEYATKPVVVFERARYGSPC
jgi:RimJ/RimL family protein N-acetyltransferase